MTTVRAFPQASARPGWIAPPRTMWGSAADYLTDDNEAVLTDDNNVPLLSEQEITAGESVKAAARPGWIARGQG